MESGEQKVMESGNSNNVCQTSTPEEITRFAKKLQNIKCKKCHKKYVLPYSYTFYDILFEGVKLVCDCETKLIKRNSKHVRCYEMIIAHGVRKFFKVYDIPEVVEL